MSEKTNVVRIFEKHKIAYKFHTYKSDGAISGVEVANALGQDCARVFKTLVTVGKSGKNYVFAIPVNAELDLKKAAKAASEKSIEMLKMKELLPLTGYVHGGCSPVGMKKFFETFFHKTAKDFDSIIFSAGKIGTQAEVSLTELSKVIRFKCEDIVVD